MTPNSWTESEHLEVDCSWFPPFRGALEDSSDAPVIVYITLVTNLNVKT